MRASATIERMTQRDYDNTATEYGGVRDNRRNPLTGRPTPRSAGQQAADLRRAGARPEQVKTSTPTGQRLA